MVAADSFMCFSEDVFAFFKGNTFHEDATNRTLVEVVTNEDETLTTPDDAGSFSAFRINMWWKLELLDEVDKLSPPIFFNHQYLSDCGRVLRVSGLLALYLD